MEATAPTPLTPSTTTPTTSTSTPTTPTPTPNSTTQSNPTPTTTTGYRRWEPVQKILYGFAVSPFNAEIHSLDLPTQIDQATAEALAIIQSHLIALEVGDEVYIFEQLGHSNVKWFRGYVVSTNRLPTNASSTSSLSDFSTLPSSSNGNNQSSSAASLVEEPQVYVGIFPASHVHIREQLDDAEMRLAEVYNKAKEDGIVGATSPPTNRSVHQSHMETLPEEEEEGENVDRNANGNGEPSSSSSKIGYRQQIGLNGNETLDSDRPPPPLPSLVGGDETLSGQKEPLVDEIACALREWGSLMYVYLGRRDYSLFHTVRQHIDVLHAARRQLLAQTLSAEEVGKLRRECVARLVKGNVAQGLDVIVRHPGRGGLVDVDFTGKESDPESWVSGIRLYALQVALAYVDQQIESTPGGGALDIAASNAFGITSPSTTNAAVLSGITSNFQRKTPSRQASISTSRHGRSETGGSNSQPSSSSNPSTGVKYFHVYLDVKAFVASPCSPGETAELYFALYNKAESRFLTEEYCVILNHQGVPAKESEGRLGKMRSLFTDLSANDMQDLNIVCRIVRNGSMRIGGGDQKSSLTPGGPGPQFNDNSSERSVDWDRSNPGGAPGFRPSRMTSDRTFRRPFGCAVLELGSAHRFQTDLANSSALREHVMPIFVPVNEAAFSTLHQDIIASRIKEFEKSSRAEMLAVNVKVLHGETSQLVRENPSLLQDAPLTARLGFPDVVFPGDQRNEAYIKLWSGEFFPLGNKMAGGSPKNIQVSAEVRTRDGRVVENVISRGSGEPLVTQFDSTVFYHQNSPTWGELIKLELPHELMEHCHVFFSFRHRSSKEERGSSSGGNGGNNHHQGGGGSMEKDENRSGSSSNGNATLNRPFAYAYLPLFESNRAFIPDGSHSLILWRSSRPADRLSPELYFSIPPTLAIGQTVSELVPPSLASLIQPLRDVLTLRSFLVSTKFTQNEILLSLLNWDSNNNGNGNGNLSSEDFFENLKSTLVRFTFVGEVEIVKFLRDIFDALFGIMVSSRNLNGELDDLVFNALVFVLGIVQDRRFTNFRATLDVYIERHFHSPSAYVRMIASMSRLLADPTKSETSQNLRASIKVWPYLFKMIVKSRENQRGEKDKPANAHLSSAMSDHLETNFKKDMDAILRSINKLMATSKPTSIIGTQTLVLQNFAGILPDLCRIYPLPEVVRIVTAFADSVFIIKGRMVVWKLLFIYQLASGVLFDDHDSRSHLIPSIVRWIRPHLGTYDESLHTNPNDLQAARDSARLAWMEGSRLAITVLAIILDRLQVGLTSGKKGKMTSNELRQEQDNVDYIVSTMPRLLETYKELNSEATVRTLESSRSPSTLASSVPVIFPSTYPFPLIAKRPAGQDYSSPSNHSSRRTNRKDRLDFLNCGLGEIAAVLTVLIMLSPRKHLAEFLNEQLDLEGKEKSAQFLLNFFDVSTSILLNEAYPSSWLNINILAHQMVLKMTDPLAALMVREFIPQADQSHTFDTNLWRSGLNMLLTLLSSEQLVIEQFKPQRRRAVWRLAGDIRGEGAQIFVKLWNSIGWPNKPSGESIPNEIVDPSRLNTGGFQVRFVPSLVEPVLELCLSHHDELRTCAVRVLATMITSEWHLNGDFTVIEAEIIDKLDVLFMNDTKGDEISRAFFIGQLRSLFESPSVDPKLQEQVQACLVSVNRFLDLLLNVRSLPLEEGFEDDRIAGTLKLLGFLRQANRVTAFSTHVLRLVNLHLENQSYVEAALTLKLHADLHTWDLDSFVEPNPDLDLPRQSHFARKETLYMLILDYLGKGQAWEISVDICRELAQQYEYRSVDYIRLADVLSHQATLYQQIASTERTYPAYFRVAYYGEQWPASLQQKMFVYRGLDWEKFAAFCERLHQKHPKATLIKSTGEPNDEIRYGDAQFLQVTALQPEPDRSKDVFTNPEVPPVVRTYFEHNTTNLFSFNRPIAKPGQQGNDAAEVEEGSSPVTDVWVEKTYLRCEDAFPTVLRRSEVAEVEVVEISPLENALNDVEAKREELETLEKKYSALAKVNTAGKINTNRLSMALNGAVDAPVNGGIPTYRQAFLTPAYLASNLDKEVLTGKLRDAIDLQVQVIYRCIKLHARLCPPEMRPFHDTLSRFLRLNFAEELARLDLDVEKIDVQADGAGSEAGGSSFEDGRNDARMFTLGSGDNWNGENKAQVGHSYVLDDHNRLQKIPFSSASHNQSPLQRHISHLSKRTQPIQAPNVQDHRSVFDAPSSIIGGSRQAAESGIGAAPQNQLNNDASTLRGTGGLSIAPSRLDQTINDGVSIKQQSIFSKAAEGGASRLSRLISTRRKN